MPLNARGLGEPGLHLVPNQASPVSPHDESQAGHFLVRPFVTIILSRMIVRVRKSGSPSPQANVAQKSSPFTGNFRRWPCPSRKPAARLRPAFVQRSFNPRAGIHCCPIRFAAMRPVRACRHRCCLIPLIPGALRRDTQRTKFVLRWWQFD